MRWAVSVLVSPDYLWIEVDNDTLAVDDVVIGKSNGTLICCQCKKNQPDGRDWTIADLKDELIKAGSLLGTRLDVSVRFYSRSPFGSLVKLRETASSYAKRETFEANIAPKLKVSNFALQALLPRSLTTYEMLSRTTFEPTPELDHLKEETRNVLGLATTNVDQAYNCIWTALDELGGRLEGTPGQVVKHRLTKSDLWDLLLRAGCIAAPPMKNASILKSLAETSSIGRRWQRDAGGQIMPHPAVPELLASIDGGAKSILLLGSPGSGKTCALLELQEELEKPEFFEQNLVSVFVQTREYADLTTVEDKKAHGLDPEWITMVARLAESHRVIVVFDSLDVLSIARERNALDYFLTCLDHLSGIPQVTTVTACRVFDRDYDRRIARQHWDNEVICGPFPWENVAPVLRQHGVDPESLAQETKELVQNPRDLALYLDLIDSGVPPEAITGQSLAQQYLETVVGGGSELGDTALIALEAMARQMLQARSLSIPALRFTGSPSILRALKSHQIVVPTQNGDLTFGHQTMVDLLAVRGAVREGLSLHDFVSQLSPVPFVRPTIRAFIAHLGMSTRNIWRGQMRTVLVSKLPFHIRRIAAETIAGNEPEVGDWTLISDLYNHHRDVFQVVFYGTKHLSWFGFWTQYLEPILRQNQDTDTYLGFLNRIGIWKNEVSEDVARLWSQALQLTWLNSTHLHWQFEVALSEVKDEQLHVYSTVIETLLENTVGERTFLGHIVARGVDAGFFDDAILWRFITRDVTQEDVAGYKISGKLGCKPHGFGTDREAFLANRMAVSETLLDYALNAIEYWNRVWSKKVGLQDDDFTESFLSQSSFRRLHERNEISSADAIDVLLASVESAMLGHAQRNSNWWSMRCEALSESKELAIRYMVIKACYETPESNIGLVVKILTNQNLWESRLEFEMGELLSTAIPLLNQVERNSIMSIVLSLHDQRVDEEDQERVRFNRASIIKAIPLYLRTEEAQELLSTVERARGPIIRTPEVFSSGGFIQSPVSRDQFLSFEDPTAVAVLRFYENHERSHFFDEDMLGGQDDVARELAAAATHAPIRFLNTLTAYWAELAPLYRKHILRGLSEHLRYQNQSLTASQPVVPIERPDLTWLAEQIADELDRHLSFWEQEEGIGVAVQACAEVTNSSNLTERLLFLALRISLKEDNSDHSGDPISIGINSTRGRLAEGLMALANNFLSKEIPWPPLLAVVLRRFASDPNPGTRAMVLSRLPIFQYHRPELGWQLFDLAMEEPTGLWKTAERCFYYGYRRNFSNVEASLSRMEQSNQDECGEVWGRISALAVLAGKLSQTEFFSKLERLASQGAWEGAAQVWTSAANLLECRETCIAGIRHGFAQTTTFAIVVARKLSRLFNDSGSLVSVPVDLVADFFRVARTETETNQLAYWGIFEWLNAQATNQPRESLEIAELYVEFVQEKRLPIHNHDNCVSQLLTRLFEVAEELEESDEGQMLSRVVKLQDALLSRQVDGLETWLRAAERP